MCSFDVCGSICVRSESVNQTNLKWALIATSSKTVKARDFKFDKHVLRESPDIIP